jgi:hypothetical protein
VLPEPNLCTHQVLEARKQAVEHRQLGPHTAEQRVGSDLLAATKNVLVFELSLYACCPEPVLVK